MKNVTQEAFITQHDIHNAISYKIAEVYMGDNSTHSRRISSSSVVSSEAVPPSNEGEASAGNAGKVSRQQSNFLSLPDQDFQVLDVRRTSRTVNASVPPVCNNPNHN